VRGFTQVTSRIGLIIFLAGVASGRLLIGFLVKKNQLLHYILALFGLSAVFFGGLYMADLGEFTYIIIFMAGATLSATMPLMITLAGVVHKEIAGGVLGAIKVAFPIGGMLIAFLMSVLSGYFSFRASLLVFPTAFLIGFVLLLDIRQLTRPTTGVVAMKRSETDPNDPAWKMRG
jgi:hypothetical protein